MHEEAIQAARAAFAAAFDAGAPSAGRIHVVRAPGRTNLIGEHTDYNDGFVLPIAVEPSVFCVSRARPDNRVRLASTAFAGQVIEIDLGARIEPGEPRWANYARGVVAEMLDAGIPLAGADLMLHNTLPVGGGLSSSAAVLVSVATSLLVLGGNRMEPDRLALMCQRAERTYAGVPVGIMDQTIVAGARAGHAMLLDCRDHSRHFVPMDPRELTIVIANTMVHHELSDGEYARRVESCRAAVEALRRRHPTVTALRDVTPQQLEAARDSMDDITYRRARHVVTEIARAREAASMLGRRRYEDFGDLMHQSHESLRTDYEVSSRELDFLVEQATRVKGVYGARMTGGGFGGCIVAMAQPRHADELITALRTAYKSEFGIDATVFATAAAGGAALLA